MEIIFILINLSIGAFVMFFPEKIRDFNIKIYRKTPFLNREIFIKIASHPVYLNAFRLSGLIIVTASVLLFLEIYG